MCFIPTSPRQHKTPGKYAIELAKRELKKIEGREEKRKTHAKGSCSNEPQIQM